MNRSLLARAALACGVLGTVSGCWIFNPGPEEPYEPEPMRPVPSTPAGIDANYPHITRIEIPTFPPLSANSSIAIDCEDRVGLWELRGMFRVPIAQSVRGTQQTVLLRGSDLGEGLGTLQLALTNTRGLRGERAVENLLVDMTPPEMDLEADTIGAGAELALWVRDEWVLGSVDVTFRGKSFRHEFAKAYPSTLGTSWDESRVSFSADELGEGRGSAVVVLADAAGNRALREIPIEVDLTPPTAHVLAPSEGAHVGRTLDLRVNGRDGQNPRPVQLEIWVNGSVVGTMLGPDATLQLDTDKLPRGEALLEAIAIDAAGNRGEPHGVRVVVD